jgi:hypothetical protein
MGTNYGLGEDLEGDAASDTWGKRARARLIMDARSETEMGTLRGFFVLNFNYTTNGGAGGINSTGDSFGIDHAYIELGGFRIGKTDSLFSTFTGYAGGIIEDDLAVPYGPFGTHQIAYTFTGSNGFSAAIALEEGANSYGTLDGAGNEGAGGWPIDDFMPACHGRCRLDAGLGWRVGRCRLRLRARRRRCQGPYRRECHRAAVAVLDGRLVVERPDLRHGPVVPRSTVSAT